MIQRAYQQLSLTTFLLEDHEAIRCMGLGKFEHIGDDEDREREPHGSDVDVQHNLNVDLLHSLDALPLIFITKEGDCPLCETYGSLSRPLAMRTSLAHDLPTETGDHLPHIRLQAKSASRPSQEGM